MRRKSNNLTGTQTTRRKSGNSRRRNKYPEVGRFLVDLLRQASGYAVSPPVTHEQLADLLHVTGGTITHWVHGEDAPDPQHLRAIFTARLRHPAFRSPIGDPEGTNLPLLDESRHAELLRVWCKDRGIPLEYIRIVSEDKYDQLIQAEQTLSQMAAEADQWQKQRAWGQFLSQMLRAFGVWLNTPDGRRDDIGHIIEAQLRLASNSYCEFIAGPSAIRAIAIYTPTETRPDWLGIKWSKGLGNESRRVNFYYGGNSEHQDLTSERGFVGTVFFNGKGQTFTDVARHDLFLNRYDDRLPSAVEYEYAVAVPIVAPRKQKTIGVLIVDSPSHRFTPTDDQPLIEDLADQLGWIIELTDTPYTSSGEIPLKLLHGS